MLKTTKAYCTFDEAAILSPDFPGPYDVKFSEDFYVIDFRSSKGISYFSSNIFNKISIKIVYIKSFLRPFKAVIILNLISQSTFNN